jgi:hypothetical protein
MKTDLRHRHLSHAAPDVVSAAFLPTDDEPASFVTVGLLNAVPAIRS